MGKYVLFSPISDVHVGEAIGLLSALKWVHDLNLDPIDFELDSKLAVNNFYSNKLDAYEFGEIISQWRGIFHSFYDNFSVNLLGDKQMKLLIS
jgi:ribonuclease HI